MRKLAARESCLTVWIPSRLCAVLLSVLLITPLRADDATDPGEVGVVSGQIVDADGAPIPAAQVRLRGRRVEKATADKEGRFSFANVAIGEYRIWAHKRELACEIQRFHNVEAGQAQEARFKPLTLRLKPAKSVRVSVVSEATGEPLAGVYLRLGYPFRRESKTQAEGTVNFLGMMSERYTLTAEMQGYARVDRELELSDARNVTEFTLKLRPGGVLRGVVTDQDGKPLSNASVSYRVPGNPVGFYGTSPKTDGKGEFRNDYLPLDEPITLSIGKDDYSTDRREVSLTAEKRERALNVKLTRRQRGGSITGTVTDEDGMPISTATVANYGDRSSRKRITSVDEKGRFQLDDLYKTYAGHEIVVRAKGFAPIRRAVNPGPADKPAEVDVVLAPGHTFRARVVDSAGKPIPAAYVNYNNGNYPGRLGATVRSNDEGLVEFDSMPPDCKFDVYAKGFSSISDASWELDGKEPVIVTMEAAGMIQGRVFDFDTSEPIKDFLVQLGFSEDRRPDDARGSYSSHLGEPGLRVASKTGRFKIPELVHRMPFEVTITADGYEKLVLSRVVASNKQDEPLRKIALKKLDPSKLFTLQGQLLDFQGRPTADAQLRLIVTSQPASVDENAFNWILVKSGQIARRGRCDQFLSSVSDSKGRFKFQHVLPGKFIHLAIWGEHAPQGRHYLTEPTKPGEMRDVRIDLPEPAAIVGSIDIAAYGDASQIQLSKKGASWHGYEFKLEKDTKEFRFPMLPPGSYSIFIQSKPERTGEGSFVLRPLASQKLNLGPGETREVEFGAADRLKGRE